MPASHQISHVILLVRDLLTKTEKWPTFWWAIFAIYLVWGNKFIYFMDILKTYVVIGMGVVMILKTMGSSTFI